MSDDFIISHIAPKGLGNILFMATAGLIVSKEKNTRLAIDFNNNLAEHNINKLDYYDILLKHFGEKVDLTDPKIKSLLDNHSSHYFVPAFSAWFPTNVPPGCVLNSYFQYYPPIKNYESLIRETILTGLQPYREKLLNLNDFKDRAFLHVRRGDYLNFPRYWFEISMNYYKRAINIIKPIKPVFVISDDINWLKEHIYFNDTRYFEIYDGNEIETLALMSLCTNGAICANSSFSWWGAFLGTYAERNVVIVPSVWCGDNIDSLFPDEWTIVDSK